MVFLRRAGDFGRVQVQGRGFSGHSLEKSLAKLRKIMVCPKKPSAHLGKTKVSLQKPSAHLGFRRQGISTTYVCSVS